VCNWTVYRKFATTFPALQYWLSVLPYGTALRQALQDVCCFDVTTVFRNQFQAREIGAAPIFGMAGPPPQPAPGAAGPAAGQPAPDASGATAFFREQAMLRLNPQLAKKSQIADASSLIAETLMSGKALDPEQMINTLLAPQAAAAKLAPEQRENLPQLLLLNQIAKPIAQAAAAPVVGAALGNLAASYMREAPNAAMREQVDALRNDVAINAAAVERVRRAQREADPAALHAEIASLRETLERHAAEIERLRAARPIAPRPRKGHK
jgi:hypothetical protein